MPQDVRELGRRVKAKYPGKYDDLADDDLGRKVKAKYPGAYDDFTDIAAGPTALPAQPPQRSELGKNLALGAEQAIYGELIPSAITGLHALGSAAMGNFGPAKEIAGLAGRRILQPLAMMAGAPGVAAEQELAIRNIEAQRQAARAENPIYGAVENVRQQVEQEAAQDPSLRGRIERGIGRFATAAAPVVATGVATGGSVPAMSLVSGLQSLNEPENIPLAAGLAAVPVPVGKALKAGLNSVRRVFGKGAAQIIEAEALPAATAAVERQAAGEAAPAVRRAMSQFEQEVARIKTLPPGQQAAEMETAIQSIGREAGGIRPVSPQSRAGYPPLMEFPAEPNPIQQAGRLPFEAEGPPPLEAETGAPQFGVKAAPEPAYRETTGPSASAPMDLNATVGQAVESIPASKAQRVKDELLGLLSLPKSLRSTLDISYPLRQGVILLLRPFQWRQSRKVLVDMFRGFKTKNFEAINEAIANHPLAGRMEAAGVHISEPGGGSLRGEEAFSRPAGAKIAEFVTQKAGKYVGIKQSDQAFTIAGNVQRVEAFQQYANAIDKAGLTPEQAAIADKAAARWVNITTGRGSLGKGADRAMETLNHFFFSPRYVASRLNILNPGMYIKNAWTPGGRVVLRQQVGDLMQYLSMVGTTMYLAKQAGADVTFNPHSPDFGKIKFGTRRYDLGAGLAQALRATYLAGEDITKALMKQKPDHGKTAIDVGKTFLEYKLSPPAGVFRDLVARRTLDKKPFTYTGAAKDLIAPMQWADFVDAFVKEGFGGVVKTLPGAAGVGVQNYEQTPLNAAIERAQPLFTELKRLNKTVSELKKRGEGDKKEPDDIFNARVQQFGQNYTLYGLKLLENERFKTASDDIKGKALEALNSRAKALTVREFAFPELELDPDTILDSVQSAEERKQERIRQRGF